MEIIAFLNSKGGVGKSTIACNIAVESVLNKKKTLLIDADSQGSSMAFRALRENNDIKAIAINTATIHKDIKAFSGFDTIIIDAGGRDTAVFRSAMLACDLMAIPVLPSQYDMWAANETLEILKDAKVYNENLKAYFLLNQLIPNTKVSIEAIEALREITDEVGILKTSLCSRVAYKSSITRGQGVTEFEPKGKASNEIRALYKELINENNKT